MYLAELLVTNPKPKHGSQPGVRNERQGANGFKTNWATSRLAVSAVTVSTLYTVRVLTKTRQVG